MAHLSQYQHGKVLTHINGNSRTTPHFQNWNLKLQNALDLKATVCNEVTLQ